MSGLTAKKKKHNILFFINITEEWFGGINYLKNLFKALKIAETSINPVISIVGDQTYIKVFNTYSEMIDYNKIDKIKILDRLFYNIFVEKFFMKFFYKNIIKIKILSHSGGRSIAVRTKKINWIPDFQHFRMPEMFSQEELKNRTRYYLNLAMGSDIILLSSYDAKKDFEKFAPEYAYKARVLQFVSIPDTDIYEDNLLIKSKLKHDYNICDNKFFYIPNQLWKHKNHMIVLKAVKTLKDKGLNIKIVCTGHEKDYRHPDYLKEIKDYIYNNELTNNIKLLGLVDYEIIPYLMRNCISIINPSLFEGWSTTVEEAKSIGKNIILSDIPVHKEQNPPAGIYFNPHDYNELAKILEKKWEESNGGPDFELEKTAKLNLNERIKNFATTYEKYVLKLLESE